MVTMAFTAISAPAPGFSSGMSALSIALDSTRQRITSSKKSLQEYVIDLLQRIVRANRANRAVCPVGNVNKEGKCCGVRPTAQPTGRGQSSRRDQRCCESDRDVRPRET